MNSKSRPNVIFVVLFGLLVSGCDMPDREEMQALMQEQSPRETDLFPGGVLVQELEQLELSAEQRNAVGCMLQGVREKLAPLAKTRQQLGQAVVTGVAAGTLDQAKINSIQKQLAAAMETARPVFKDFLFRLHCVLDSTQRQQLASAFLQRMARTSVGCQGGCQGKGGCSGKDGKGLFHQLGLSKDQKMSIMFDMRDAFADAPKQGKLQQRRARIKALAQAFAADTFDTSKLQQQDTKPEPGLARMCKMLGIILPVLTGDQRAAFATLIKNKMAEKAKSSTKFSGDSCWLNDTLKQCAQKAAQASKSNKGNQGSDKGNSCKGKGDGNGKAKGDGCKGMGKGCKGKGHCEGKASHGAWNGSSYQPLQ